MIGTKLYMCHLCIKLRQPLYLHICTLKLIHHVVKSAYNPPLTHIHSFTQVNTHTQACAHIHARTCAHTHTHTTLTTNKQTDTHSYMHTHCM